MYLKFSFVIIVYVFVNISSLLAAEVQERNPFIAVFGVANDNTLTIADHQAGKLNPEIQFYRFWGLKVLDQKSLQAFLNGRALKCLTIYSVDDLGVIDCIAAPQRDETYKPTLRTNDWLDVFSWLSEFGITEKWCDANDLAKRISFQNPHILYFCTRPAMMSSDEPYSITHGDLVPVKRLIGAPTGLY